MAVQERPAVSNDLLALVFDQAAVGLCLVAPDGTVLRVNPEWSRATGFAGEQLIGGDIVDVFPEAWDMAALHARARAGQHVDVPPHRLEVRGRPTWWEGRISPVPMDGGTGLLITARAITEQLVRHLEAVARDGAAVPGDDCGLAVLLDSVKDYALFMLDPQGRVTSWSSGAERIKGYRSAEIVGHHFSRFYTPEDVAGGKPDAELKAAGTTGRFEDAGWRVRKDGSRFWANVVISRATDPSGRLLGFAKVTRDLSDRKRSEDALRESEQKYAVIYDKAPFAIALTRLPEGTTVSVNDAFLRLFEYAREEVVGKSSVDLGISDLASRAQVAAELQRRGSVREFECSRITKSGARRVLSINVDEVSIGGQRFSLTTVQDITERKRAMEQLAAEKERLAVTLRCIGDGVIATDEAARVTILNSVAEELTGWKAEEAQGRPLHEVFEIISEDTRRPAPNPVDRVLREGVIVGMANHTALVARDGAERPIADSGAPIRDSSGNISGVVLVFRDQTEDRRVQQLQRRAEEVLKESESKYRSLFENMTEEVHFWQVVRDEEGRIQTWRLVDANPPTLKTWGRKAIDEIRGKTTDEIFGPGATDHYMSVVRKVMTEGVPYSFEDYLPHLDKFFRFTTIPLADHFITTGADVSIIKKAQRALEETNDQLREANRLKDEFLSMASHELRTPLTTLRLQADSLARGLRKSRLADERMEHKLSVMDLQLDRLEALIHALLDVSRISAGRLVLDLAELDLAELARGVVERFESEAETAGSELRLVARGVVGTWDRERIDQVITNLVSNALKYGGGQPVEVTLDERDGAAVLVVRDHGIGIAAESQARIFERYERAANTRPVGGLGLGLWIARRMAEAHGGTIAVESAPGAGSAFTLTLPRFRR